MAILPECINAPKDKIDGTQIATNRPVSLSPVNHKYTDNKKESPAAIKIDTLLILIELLILNSLFRLWVWAH